MALCIDAPLRLRPGLLSLLTLFQVPLVEPVVTAQLQAVSAPANPVYYLAKCILQQKVSVSVLCACVSVWLSHVVCEESPTVEVFGHC